MVGRPPNYGCTECPIRARTIFREVPDRELTQICAHKTCNIYRKGQVIFYEGNHPVGLFFLHSGKVKIYKKGLWGREQIVRLAMPGDLLTYRVLGGSGHYTVGAIAIEDSAVCCLDPGNFYRVLAGNLPLLREVVQLLTMELDRAEEAIRDLSQQTVRQRLANVLLLFGKRFRPRGGELPESGLPGSGSPESGFLDIQLSREELANLIGTATETVVRLLSEFREKRLVTVEGQKFQILDLARLERIAHSERQVH